MSDGVLTRMGMIEIWQWYGTTEYQNPQHSLLVHLTEISIFSIEEVHSPV